MDTDPCEPVREPRTLERVIELIDEHAKNLENAGQQSLADEQHQISDWLRELRSARERIKELLSEVTSLNGRAYRAEEVATEMRARACEAVQTILYKEPDREGDWGRGWNAGVYQAITEIQDLHPIPPT